ncbi:MAG: hypothetical protein B7Z79_12390 [Thiomonas sp. 20-64-9]|jgi:hypothetical protein|uniref:hypothetical protein n=1 Tax=Thiomonas TaxID=32012 RepID=UPI000BCA6176|nr:MULTISPECIES: hypothetical protein [Thiomonas]OYV28624.1 MAG: hypothetical protein B7Z79_12390 [Thiomonas sp. 20-64-9]OZB52253.1 MAG: hypothetical protein B7X43_04270 [Thiomonas sp. 15-63-373]HML81047.1 hypothetical protein [Thiomonas arsenitoxydans]
MATPGKLYVVGFGGKDHLVRAFTQRGAAKGLIRSLTESTLENTRPASQDDILELAGNGVRPIDVTVTELEDQPGTGECE